jgi:epoxyqueuosine reductase QueG
MLTQNENRKKLVIDSELTSEIKDFALGGLNADLVGIANIERFVNAPKRMCPQGLMPNAKSVIVMAVTHLDGTIEVGGQQHPQEIGPYWIQYGMNNRLDEMSYRMALHLEDRGFMAVPIASSNIWRYKGYKELTEQFAPDVSHMHCAVAAGLAEFGYNGLAITPEYGARQRYVTIITDAELTPSPLIEPGTICDNCMLCRKHCMSQALAKEIDGWNIVKIEDKEYKYAKKNLWRCSWGEHFDIDLDLELPDKVDENVILENLHKHGKRGGEMGSCLRYCVPKNMRYFDKEYTNAPRRKRHVNPNENLPIHRGLFEKVRAISSHYNLDYTLSLDAASLKDKIDEKHILPDAQTVILCGLVIPNSLTKAPGLEIDYHEHKADNGLLNFSINYSGYVTAYDMARELQRWGYSSSILNERITDDLLKELNIEAPEDHWLLAFGVMTSANLPKTDTELQIKTRETCSPKQLETKLKFLTSKFGITTSGVSSVTRFNKLAEQVAPKYDGRTVITGIDRAPAHVEVKPEVTVSEMKFLRPEDYLTDAKSVIVLGLKMPQGAIECCARYDCEAIGPYAFVTYESHRVMYLAALNMAKELNKLGFKAKVTSDLSNTAAMVGNSRGSQADVFSNRFAAVSAGLGRLSKCGFVINPEHGGGMRYLAIVTDAELTESEVCSADLATACTNCESCVKSCKTQAFQEPVEFALDGVSESFHRIDTNRCEWAKRYTFIPESGNMFMGWDFEIKAPEKITKENLHEAMKQIPPISKHHACGFEKCFMSCPIVRSQEQ